MSGGFDELSGDPELGSSASALREQWRLEEEEYVRAAEQHWAHGRTMLDIARELMHRGDTVVIDLFGASFVGTVVAVGDDYLQLATTSMVVDLRLTGVPAVLRVVERSPVGGCRGLPGSPTFRARLLEHEVTGGHVVVGSWFTGEQHRGSILVGRDQVLVSGPTDIYLPMSWIAWVGSGSGAGGA